MKRPRDATHMKSRIKTNTATAIAMISGISQGGADPSVVEKLLCVTDRKFQLLPRQLKLKLFPQAPLRNAANAMVSHFPKSNGWKRTIFIHS